MDKATLEKLLKEAETEILNNFDNEEKINVLYGLFGNCRADVRFFDSDLFKEEDKVFTEKLIKLLIYVAKTAKKE